MKGLKISESSKKSNKEFFEEIFEIFLEDGKYTLSVYLSNGDVIDLSWDNIYEVIFSDNYIVIKFSYPAMTMFPYDSVVSVQGRQVDLINKYIKEEHDEENRRGTDNGEGEKVQKTGKSLLKWRRHL